VFAVAVDLIQMSVSIPRKLNQITNPDDLFDRLSRKLFARQ
jgi:hypothetical protein